MIDGDAFMKSSPFQITHGGDFNHQYNLNNSTPELLKFQLQEQYRTKLSDLKENHHDLPNLNLLYTQFLQGSFNNHLQTNLDQGNISLEDEVPSLSSTPITDNEEDSYTCIGNSRPNYMNLKLLIENSVFDSSKINKDSILSLSKLKTLRQEIQEKEELKTYLISKSSLSQDFYSEMILNSERHEEIGLDTPLLLKFIKLHNLLQQELMRVSDELDESTRRLTNHNLACLVLGYVEDIKLTSMASNKLPLSASSPSDISQGTPIQATNEQPLQLINKSFDSLFSHIAHIAVQRNIKLPQPDSRSNPETIESRIQWAQSCIDTILSVQRVPPHTPIEDKSMNLTVDDSTRNDLTKDNSFLNELSFTSGSPLRPQNSNKILADYRTALNDLRFSHEYLTREYEHSKESSIKLIQEYRKKNSLLEKELNKRDGKSPASISNPKIDVDDSFDTKDKEISRLRKELNLLKIDKLGIKQGGSKLTSPTTSSTSNISTLSPITSNFSADYMDAGPESADVNCLISTRPTSIGTNSMSNGILRTEFKKIVEDIHNQYELQLGEEKLQRRKLQEALNAINSHS